MVEGVQQGLVLVGTFFSCFEKRIFSVGWQEQASRRREA